jgi:hypothetical protein
MILIENQIIATDLSATSTDPSFPLANLINYNPTLPWKSTASTDTITITKTGIGTMNVAAIRCEGVSSITYKIYDGAVLEDSGSMEKYDKVYPYSDFWLDNQNISPSSKIELTINGTPGKANAGVIRAGGNYTFDDPQNISYSYKDFSIFKRTRNQAIYIKEKNRIDIFSGQIISPLLPSGKPEVVQACKLLAPYPIAIKLLKSASFGNVIFGTMKSQSQAYNGVFKYGDDKIAPCSFTIEEVI